MVNKEERKTLETIANNNRDFHGKWNKMKPFRKFMVCKVKVAVNLETGKLNNLIQKLRKTQPKIL